MLSVEKTTSFDLRDLPASVPLPPSAGIKDVHHYAPLKQLLFWDVLPK